MTATDLCDIISSEEYRKELTEMSSYLASVMQERPIVFALAKQLWKARRHKFQLEAKLKDLVVDGTHIEFKYNFYCGMGKLNDEVSRHGDSLAPMWDAVRRKKLSKSWGIMAKIYEDVCIKKPDIFVWVICARDISQLSRDDQGRVCWSKAQSKWDKTCPYSDRSHLAVADLLLDKLKAARGGFHVHTVEIASNGDFPSIYTFKICQLTNSTK